MFVQVVMLSSQVASLDWHRQQEPSHRTSYLNALEVQLQGGEVEGLPDGSEEEAGLRPLFHEFHGNSSHTDHFKLLKEDGSSVLVGARNVIYNLSLPNLLEFTEEVSQAICSHLWDRLSFPGTNSNLPVFKSKVIDIFHTSFKHNLLPMMDFYLQI